MPAIRYTTIGRHRPRVRRRRRGRPRSRTRSSIGCSARLEIVGAENRDGGACARAAADSRADVARLRRRRAGEHLARASTGSASTSRAWDPRDSAALGVTHGVNVVIILVGAFIVVRAANLAIEHLQFKLARRHATTDLEWQRRAATLSGILTSLVTRHGRRSSRF